MKSFHETARFDCALLRSGSPLVLNITNQVASPFTANVLLSLGASPLMSSEPKEIEKLVTIARSLSVNIGCLDQRQEEAMTKAVRKARETGIPWVFDPAGVGLSAYRSVAAEHLLSFSPSVIRGNASEIMSLAGMECRQRGVDSAEKSRDAVEAALLLSSRYRTTVFVSGDVDYITDSYKVAAVKGGDERMTRITAMGCSLSSAVAACAAVDPDPLSASVAASVLYAHAGKKAALESRGNGSFMTAFLDILSTSDEDEDRSEVEVDVKTVSDFKYER